MMMIERLPGWYKVLWRPGFWEVAKWDGHHWEVVGDADKYDDDLFLKVGDKVDFNDTRS